MRLGVAPAWRLSPTRRLALAVTLLPFLVLAGLPDAQAVNPAVKRACANDYFAHCSMFAVDTPAVRQCMRKVGRNLSPPCINALAAAGEVSKDEMKRYRAAVARR